MLLMLCCSEEKGKIIEILLELILFPFSVSILAGQTPAAMFTFAHAAERWARRRSFAL